MRELVSAMLEPGFYPDRPSAVELRETHISWVFLAGELAYKVKKPLVLPFLDYGTLERRREMCHEEVRLNRRLAPSIYLDVVGIASSGDAFVLTSADDSGACEYAVRMRRVEEGRSLAALVARRELLDGQVDVVAALLARFHAEAETVRSDGGSVDELVATLDENAATLREAGAEVLAAGRIDAAERFAAAFVERHRGELLARERAGLVRDCHGDLRAEHVIVPAAGDVYVYDCIEFDPALRRIDVAADLSFLVMDLTSLGADRGASRLLDAYRAAGGDPGADELVSFYAAYRAWVRAKVACLRAAGLPVGDPARVGAEVDARRLLELGHVFAWRARGPAVLVLCGVTGSGKTTIARSVSDASRWPHVSSDLTRKRLVGIAPHERGSEEHYSDEVTLRTYEELGRAAAERLGSEPGVIVDATFHRRHEVAAFRRGLGDTGVPVLFVCCDADPDVLRARVRARKGDPNRVSDADLDVLERQLRDRDALDVAEAERVDLDTAAPPDDLLREVEELVDRLDRS